MRCAVQPYEGNDPYIYFSFCEADEAFAAPIVESLVKNGYRVWYDDGHIPDDVWLETIAERLSNSRVCMAFVSEAYVDTHNCRNHLIMAMEQDVLIVPILKTDFPMTPAMGLLMQKTPFVKAYTYTLTSASGMEAFLKTVLKPAECSLCQQASFRDKPWTMICVDPNVQKKAAPSKNIPKSILAEPGLSGCTIALKTSTDAPVKDDEPHIQTQAEDPAPSDAENEEVTVRIDLPTVVIRPKDDKALIDLSLGRVFRLRDGVIRLGRSKTNDYCFDDRSISAKHAQFFVNEQGKAMVRDVGSTNGTFLNGVRIDPNSSLEVGNFSIITLSDSRHLLYLTGKSVSDMLQLGYSAYLICEENKEVMALHPGFILGRENPWPSGAFSEKSISHAHGVFQADKEGYRFFAGHSTNGTTFNGVQILEGQQTGLLKTGDEIGVARQYRIKYHVVKIRED